MMGVARLRRWMGYPCVQSIAHTDLLSDRLGLWLVKPSVGMGIILATIIWLSPVVAWAEDLPQDKMPSSQSSVDENSHLTILDDVGSALGWLDNQLEVAIDASEAGDVAEPTDSFNLLTSSGDVTPVTSETVGKPNPLVNLKGWFDRQLEKGAAASLSQDEQPEIATISEAPNDFVSTSLTDLPPQVDSLVIIQDQPGVALQTKPLILTRSLSGKPKVTGKPDGLLVNPADNAHKFRKPIKPELMVDTDKKEEPTELAPLSNNYLQKASTE